MLNVRRASHKRESSRPSIINFSEEGAPKPFDMANSLPRPATSLSQRFSNTAEPATSLLPANEESQRRRQSAPYENNVDSPSLATSSLHPNMNLSQRFSNTVAPLARFSAANGQIHGPVPYAALSESHDCAAQRDVSTDSHGVTNPVSFEFDKSHGYLPFVIHSAAPMNGVKTPETGYRTLETFLQAVSCQRLNRMPHRASKWDRVIRILEGLAIQVSGFTKTCESFPLTTYETASRTFATCFELLRISSSNPAFLNIAVPVLAEARRIFAATLWQKELLDRNETIKQIVDQLMTSVLSLMMELLACGQDFTSGGQTGVGHFRRPISVIHDRRNQLAVEFWACQFPSDSHDNQDLISQLTRIRYWLKSKDGIVCNFYTSLQASRALHVEFTCEWFARPLLDFLRSSDKIFWIEGPVGCGKSILCGWIVDSLQSQVGGHEYAVLSHYLDPLLPSEHDVACLLKGLLQQAFEQNPGSMDFYEALTQAMNIAAMPSGVLDVNETLWHAFEVALRQLSRASILIIDGLDALDGGGTVATECLKRLSVLVSKSRMARLLVISRPFDQPSDLALRRLAIQPSNVREDIRRVIDATIAADFPEGLPEISDWIIGKANGNFLWVQLTLRNLRSNLRQGKSIPYKTLPTSLNATASLSLAEVDIRDPTICLLLSASLVAVRPLSVGEAQSLLSVDVAHRSFDKQEHDIANIVAQGCGSIMIVEDGVIYFRHALFKRVVREIMESKLRHALEDFHTDMVDRLLLYLSLVVTNHSELTFKLMASCSVDDLLSSHSLLTYALRYWTRHLIQSGRFQDSQALDYAGDLKQVLPESVFMATLEATYWASQTPVEALKALSIATQARRQSLGNHPATLQSLGFLAIHFRGTGQLVEAATTFATAFQLAQQLLPDFHDFTIECITECLAIIQSTSDMTSSNLPVSVPDMLRYMISNYNAQFGPGNDRALEFYSLLARHYADTDQYGLSTRVQRDIYRLTIDRYGKSSPQTKAVANDLTVLVQKSDRSEENEQDNDLVYENAMSTLAVTDARRIKASISKAETLRSQHDSLNAELEYLALLHGITESYETQENDEDREKVVKVGTLYAVYLSEQGRREEAQSVLLGLWAHFANEQDKTTAHDSLVEIAIAIKQAGLPAMALIILHSVVEPFDPQVRDSNQIQEVEKTIFQIADDLVSNIRTGEILSPATEDALMKAFEYARTQGIADSLLRTCQSLISNFILEDRWHEVLHVASGALNILWPAIQEDPSDSLLSGEFDQDLGEVAVSLAKAYGAIGAEAAAGNIYWHVLRAAKNSGANDPPFFASIAKAAIKTFEQTGRTKQMLDATQELVCHYQVTLGEDDPVTIETSYALASLYVENGEADIAKRHYARIASTFQRSGYYEQRALPALQALLGIHLNKKSWEQAEKVYSSLWQTFLQKGTEYCMDQTSTKVLYKGYSQLLENQLGVDIGTLHGLRMEYRQGCMNAFGQQALITLEATIALAKSLERSESTKDEAFHLYESIISQQEDSHSPHHHDIVDIKKQVQSSLRKHYRAQLDGKMDEQTLARAISLQQNQYLDDQENSGPTSPQSLSGLAVWVSLLTRKGSSHSRDIAVHELQQAVKSVMLSNNEGKALYDAATALAASYLEGGYANEGIAITQMIRKQLIFREQSNAESHLWSRSKLTFLTAFETRMRGSMKGFAEIHSRTLLEVAFWDSFEALRNSTSLPELIIERGAKLQNLLKGHYPTYDGERLQHQLFDQFMDSYSVAFTSGSQTTRKFFDAVLRALGRGQTDIEFAQLACITLTEEAQRLVGRKDFREALDLSIPGFDFVRYNGTYGSESGLPYGFQLGLILGDVGPRLSSDQAFSKQMLELSKQILREVLHLCRTNELDLDKISIDELSEVAAVLGRQQNYYDLEWLLNRLWASRHKRGSLSQEAIVTLGRRLVDVRFFHGHLDSAIDLAEDILYNLRQVYGPSHPAAVQMMNLLSSIYMSKGDRAAAMAVHEAAEQEVATSKPFGRDNTVLSPESIPEDKLIKSKIEQLLQHYQQSDDSENPMRTSAQLIDELSRRLNAPPAIANTANTLAHQPPANWSFAVDNDGGQSNRMEQLA